MFRRSSRRKVGSYGFLVAFTVLCCFLFIVIILKGSYQTTTPPLISNSITHFVVTNRNVRMPKIIYGTAWKKEKTTEMVISAIKTGFRGIDTACQPKHYNEALVGEALVQLSKTGIERSTLFIQTKFTPFSGQDPENVPYDPHAPLEDQVKQSLATSLKNLHTHYIDSLILHSPMETPEQTMVVWRVFEEFLDQGKVKQLGISNINDLNHLQHIWDESQVKPSIIQNRFTKESNYDKNILEFCKSKGVIYQSFWTLTANTDVISSLIVKDIASKIGKTPEQVFFRFVMEIGIVPLTGTTNQFHMREDLDVLDFQLSGDDVTEIRRLMLGLNEVE